MDIFFNHLLDLVEIYSIIWLILFDDLAHSLLQCLNMSSDCILSFTHRLDESIINEINFIHCNINVFSVS